MKNRLRVLRAERNWTQAELGAQVGLSRQAINAIENDQFDPSLGSAFAIARTFGLEIEMIFDPEDGTGSSD